MVAGLIVGPHAQCTDMRTLPLTLFFLLISASAFAQNDSASVSSGGFYYRWEVRTNAIQSKQPAWAVPRVAISILRTNYA
jgi:hypothetical protein